MAELSSFFKSVGGDRKYTSARFAEYFAALLTDGIFNGGTNLEVFANGSENKTFVRAGLAWINGYYYNNTSELEITHNTADPTNDRIDRIVVRLDLDDGARNIRIFVKSGTPAADPEPPTLTRNSTVYELSLAQVLIPADTVAIPDVNVTDERLNSDVCGLVNSLIQVDTSTFQQQWDDFMETLEGQGYTPQTEFDEHKADVAHQGGRIYAYKNLGGAL